MVMAQAPQSIPTIFTLSLSMGESAVCIWLFIAVINPGRTAPGTLNEAVTVTLKLGFKVKLSRCLVAESLAR
jgi:hypothetical protein